MKHRLSAWSQKIVSPITENPVFFTAIFIINYIPSLLYWVVNYTSWLRLYAILAAPVIFALAYMLTFVVKQLRKKEQSAKIVVYLLFGIPALIETILVANFHTRFSALMFRLMAETNTNEAAEFLETYLFQKETIITIVLFLVFGIVTYLFENLLSNITIKIPRIFTKILACCLVTTTALYLYRDINFLPKYFAKNIDEIMATRPIRYGTPYVSLGYFFQSAKIHSLSFQDVDNLAHTLSKPTSATCHYNGNIILIIGESYSKNHSSLYGYTLHTNPQLQDEHDKSNLTLFKNVITSHNSTSQSIQRMISLYNQDSETYWTNYQLFPPIYRSAGFKTLLISNQESATEAEEWDCANYYLVAPKTSHFLFDWHTNEIKQWDMDLVRENADSINKYKANRNLIIYHLMGQHTGYLERCPDNERIFTVSDYNHRKDITDKQKEYVAHYDNATRYNDKVVATILDQFREQDAIVIYLSDHGEEVYDYRDHMGRSHEPIVTPERAKYQFEIPFMIWMSDKYKQNHLDMVARIERSVDRPYMIDDLPHLMLDLAGIECEWFDPTRSVINDKFNTKRKRLLLDSKQDYDEIMKGAK